MLSTSLSRSRHVEVYGFAVHFKEFVLSKERRFRKVLFVMWFVPIFVRVLGGHWEREVHPSAAGHIRAIKGRDEIPSGT